MKIKDEITIIKDTDTVNIHLDNIEYLNSLMVFDPLYERYKWGLTVNAELKEIVYFINEQIISMYSLKCIEEMLNQHNVPSKKMWYQTGKFTIMIQYNKLNKIRKLNVLLNGN